jgi:ATP-dependent RNA helicase DDX35
MTDGSLIREIMQDPLLRKYSVIMLDDVHERSLSTDLLMGLLKKIRRKRPDLKLIVSSATIEANKIARYFEDGESGLHSKIIQVQGRQYEVERLFLEKPVKNFIVKSAELARDIHCQEAEGDILVFLTGQEEIETFISIFRDICPKQGYALLPLHAKLATDKQIDILQKAPSGTRTNSVMKERSSSPPT